MGVAKGYLLLYNVAQSVGWALALFQTLRAIVQDGSLDHVYPAAGLTVRECLALHWQRLPRPLPDVPRPLASFLTTELCHAVCYAVGHAAADQAVTVAGVCQGAAVLEIVHAAAGASGCLLQLRLEGLALWFRPVLGYWPSDFTSSPHSHHVCSRSGVAACGILVDLDLCRQGWCAGRRSTHSCSGWAAATASSQFCTAYQRCAWQRYLR